MPIPTDHLSVSQVGTFRTCPMRYYYRYERGLIIPPDGALVRGSAVHRGIEWNYRQKVESGEDLEPGVVMDVTAAAFDLGADVAEFRPDEKRGELLDSAVALAKVHTEQIAPKVQPVEVEKRVEFRVAGVPVPILGFVDVVDITRTIRDNKTASKSPAEDAAAKSFQLTGYAMAYYEQEGRLPAAVALDYMVATKVPKTVTQTAARTEADLARFTMVVGQVARAIEDGAYWCNEDGWWCSPKWCGYYEICHKEMG